MGVLTCAVQVAPNRAVPLVIFVVCEAGKFWNIWISVKSLIIFRLKPLWGMDNVLLYLWRAEENLWGSGEKTEATSLGLFQWEFLFLLHLKRMTQIILKKGLEAKLVIHGLFPYIGWILIWRKFYKPLWVKRYKIEWLHSTRIIHRSCFCMIALFPRALQIWD